MKHISVLLNETIDNLNIKPNGIYVDATLGGGGHSEEILKRLNGSGHLYAFDQDDYAIKKAKERLKGYTNLTTIKANFAFLKEELFKMGVSKIDGIVFDLGLSSFQIDDEKRGFSYLKDATLDMRMDKESKISALEIVNEYSSDDLTKIFYLYGEEKNSRRIANEIIRRRPINTTNELVSICDKINYDVKGHSAKRVFQALRIAVNDEITVLEKVLDDLIPLLNKKARVCIITFHSLEDRIVKHFIKKNSEIDIPKNVIILDNRKAPLKKITRKPILPTEIEQMQNSRSKSAKLRVAEKE